MSDDLLDGMFELGVEEFASGFRVVRAGVVEAELTSMCLLCGGEAMVSQSVEQCRPDYHARLLGTWKPSEF